MPRERKSLGHLPKQRASIRRRGDWALPATTQDSKDSKDIPTVAIIPVVQAPETNATPHSGSGGHRQNPTRLHVQPPEANATPHDGSDAHRQNPTRLHVQAPKANATPHSGSGHRQNPTRLHVQPGSQATGNFRSGAVYQSPRASRSSVQSPTASCSSAQSPSSICSLSCRQPSDNSTSRFLDPYGAPSCGSVSSTDSSASLSMYFVTPCSSEGEANRLRIPSLKPRLSRTARLRTLPGAGERSPSPSSPLSSSASYRTMQSLRSQSTDDEPDTSDSGVVWKPLHRPRSAPSGAERSYMEMRKMPTPPDLVAPAFETILKLYPASVSYRERRKHLQR